MTVFTTFRDAADAARSMAIENQQTVYVFRIRDDNWSISSELRDSGNVEGASPETGPEYPIPGKTETASPGMKDFPF